MENKIEALQKKIRENSLVISRLPKNTKDGFIAFANEEFCGDYGMALKNIFDNFKLWRLLFENIDMKLNNILEIISHSEQEEQTEEKVTTLSGRTLEKNRTAGRLDYGKNR